MDAELSRQLQKGWDSTCRVIFGQEMGELSDYSKYLAKWNMKSAKANSCISGKEVTLVSSDYPKSARFVSADEISLNRDYSLSINQIKDLDSLLAALSEKCEYAGNRRLGNNMLVESSDVVTDSQYVFASTNIEKSACVYQSFMIRKDSKYSFGSGWLAKGEFVLRCLGAHTIKRCFESHYAVSSSDLYYCHSCVGCHDLLFSFGQRSASYKIGNLALPKDKYRKIKANLVSEMAGRLKQDKALPLLIELASGAPAAHLPKISPIEPKDEKNMGTIRKGFANTYGIILKRQPKHSLEEYGRWLSDKSIAVEPCTTPYGRKATRAKDFTWMRIIPDSRLVSVFELLEIGKHPMPEQAASSLDRVFSYMRDNLFATCEFFDGENFNVNETPCTYGAVGTYRAFDATDAENVAYTSIALNTKFVYGGNWLLESEFCMNCSYSNHLARCLEMDFCTKCSDCHFCHNCEGLSDLSLIHI